MRFPVGALIMLMIAGICFFLWVSFDYTFLGEGGLKENLWKSANKTLDGAVKSRFDDNMVQFDTFFGIFGFFCLGIAILIFVVDVLRKPPGDMY